MMKLRSKPFTTGVTLAAIAAATSLIVEQQLSIAPVPGTSRSLHTTVRETFPFDPPIIHPGWGSQVDAFKSSHPRPNGATAMSRDLLFRNEDRRSFKALHPFLLREPRSVPVQRTQPGKAPVNPKPKHKRLKI